MKVGERGQVTIPKRFRQRFGIRAATEVEFVEVDGLLVLRKRRLDDCPIDEYVGVLGRAGERSADAIEELRGR